MVKLRVLVPALLMGLLPTPVAFPGAQHNVQCTNPDCGFADQVMIGGGRASDLVSGYCLAEGRFVSLSWRRPARPPRDDQPAPPKPAQVFSLATGQVLELYQCPHCPSLFLPVRQAEDLKYCPKCRKATLQHPLVMHYD